MKSLIKYLNFKSIANGFGLRFSRSCIGKLDSIANETVQRACKKAKKEGASQLNPEHFDD